VAIIYNEQKEEITLAIYLKHLTEFLDYQLDGGTEYRIKTAECSLHLAKMGKEPHFFSNLDRGFAWVKEKFPDENNERQIDIAQHLYHSYWHLYNVLNIADEIQQALKARQKSRKIKLIRRESLPRTIDSP